MYELAQALWAMYPRAFEFMPTIMREMRAHGLKAGVAEDASRDGKPVTVTGRTAVIALNGPMLKKENVFTKFYGFASTRAVQRALAAAVEDDGIDTIILAVDSPGGSVDGTVELADAVYEAAQIKNVIAHVDGMAASAAYFVASQARQVFVHAGSDMVGSIGTRIMLYDFSQMFENDGIKAIPVDTGDFKSAGAMGTKLTEEQIADFQRIVDAANGFFLAAVQRGRNMDAKAVKAVADGRMFTAGEALSLGLIDGIKTISETLSDLNQKTTGRSTKAAKVRVSLMEQITRKF